MRKANKIRTQIWMCERWYKVGDHTIPIRGVCRAMTRKRAQQRAAEGCEAANQQLTATHGVEPGTPQGHAIALYPIAYA